MYTAMLRHLLGLFTWSEKQKKRIKDLGFRVFPNPMCHMLDPKSCDTTDIPICLFVHTTCSRCKWQYRLPYVILNSVDFSVCAVAKLAR